MAQAADITVIPATKLQTMRGWEVVAQADQFTSQFDAYKNAAFDKVVEAGINRVRLEVRSGSENSYDSFGAWKAAGFPTARSSDPVNNPYPYDIWRATRYTTVNDDGNPNTMNTNGRFHFSELDDSVTRIVNPLRQRLAAKGESLYVNLTYVGFYNGQTVPNVHQTPAEYAEFMLALFQHMQQTHGWVPNAINVVLEPDNTINWGGDLLGQVIAATGQRLAAAGFTPEFISPSTTNMSTAPVWFGDMWKVTAARPFIKELSYHRYHGVSAGALASIVSQAQTAGVATSMLEWWDQPPTMGADHTVLHEDLTAGRNSAWEQSVIVDLASTGGMSISHINSSNVAVFTHRTNFLRRYYEHVRIGHRRVNATSTNGGLAPLAFENPTNGRITVVVKANAASTFSIGGLPAGTYGISYTGSTTASPFVADQIGNRPDQTITSGQDLTTSIPAYGVITIYGKTGSGGGNACDLDGQGGVLVSDVQICANQAIAVAPCIPAGQSGSGDIDRNGSCQVIDVQRVVVAALGGTCVVTP